MARRIGALQRNIQNLSRAINKIDPGLKDNTKGIQYEISDIKMGINDFSYRKDGIMKKVRYDEIKKLSEYEQASLLGKLSADRYELRQKKAIESFQKKGTVSKSFLRTIEKDNPALAESIKEFQDVVKDPKEKIAEEFSKIDYSRDIYDEANDFFQEEGSEFLADFYHGVGFTKMNTFTWQAYKVMRGLEV